MPAVPAMLDPEKAVNPPRLLVMVAAPAVLVWTNTVSLPKLLEMIALPAQIVAAWGAVGSFFTGIWGDIKGAFGTIGQHVGLANTAKAERAQCPAVLGLGGDAGANLGYFQHLSSP